MEEALSEEWCTQGVFVWMSSSWRELGKMDETCMMSIMWSLWCNVTERKIKPKWKQPCHQVHLFIWRWLWLSKCKLQRQQWIHSFCFCYLGCLLTCVFLPLVDNRWCDSTIAISCVHENKRHSTHWSLLYSSNFKIYWDWLVFANNSQANSSTKHELERGLDGWRACPNIKTGGSWLTVKMFCDQYYQPKKISAQEHLKSAQNKTGVKTGQFFFDYLAHFVTNTGLW